METEIQSGNCVITSHKLFLCCCVVVELLLRFYHGGLFEWLFYPKHGGNRFFWNLGTYHTVWPNCRRLWAWYLRSDTHFFSYSRCKSDSNELLGWLKYRHNFKIILNSRLCACKSPMCYQCDSITGK